MTFVNPFTQPGQWYKANFHTHTCTSDGQRTPEETVALYKRHGYKVLALTDHVATNDVSRFSRSGVRVISGMEYHPHLPGGSNDSHHLVALNVPHGFRFDPAIVDDANACIRAVKAAGGESILAHPHWCMHRYDQYAYLQGLAGVEVFNATCTHIGRGSSEHDWSQLLDAGRLMPGLAVDDSHSAHDDCQGWVWLKLRALRVADVMEALRKGCFFSSTGPRIHDFAIRDGKVVVRCSPASEVMIVAHGVVSGAACFAERTPLRALEFPLQPDWSCFRVVVVDARGRRAWSNPIVIDVAATERMARHVQARMKANWGTSYPEARKVPERGWEMLDLAGVANRGLAGPDGWIGMGLPLVQVAPGIRRVHGVPFRILDQQANGGRAAIALHSVRMRESNGRPIADPTVIPLNQSCRSVYVLHGGGFMGKHQKVASYEFVYDDGVSRTVNIACLGTKRAVGRRQAALERRSAVADWWKDCPQFDHETAKQVMVARTEAPLDCRYLYTLRWSNPRPARRIREIRLHGAPDVGGVLLVLAVTVEKAEA